MSCGSDASKIRSDHDPESLDNKFKSDEELRRSVRDPIMEETTTTKSSGYSQARGGSEEQ